MHHTTADSLSDTIPQIGTAPAGWRLERHAHGRRDFVDAAGGPSAALVICGWTWAGAGMGLRRGGGRGGPISVEDLIAAKRLVSHFGTADRALAAIAALKRLES
jgi:hypothetical protein